MKIFYNFLALFILLIGFTTAFSQKSTRAAQTKTDALSVSNQAVKSSPAYAMLILRRTDIRANIEEMLSTYTEDFPKVKDARQEMDLINFALRRLLETNVTDSCKLSESLGQLLMKKVAVEMDLWNLKKRYKEDHPDVIRVKRKLEIYEKAVGEVLP